EELKNIRTSGTPPVLQRAVVIEVISDPFSLTQEYLDQLATTISNPEVVDVMPINSIVARVISANQGIDGSANIVLFPFFSSHFLMPVNPGETVYVIFENLQNLGTKIGFWLTRGHTYRTIEDLNYTHADRMFQGNLNPGNYSTSDKANKPTDSPVPDFPNGAGTSDSVTLSTDEKNKDPFQNIIENSISYPLITPEAVPRWIKRPQEFVLQGSNNALINLGEDRNGSIYGASGSNATDMRGQAGTIDIVVGRGRIKTLPEFNPGDGSSPTSCRTIINSRNNEENDKAPFVRSQNNTENINEGNPDPINDAARIYVTQQSNVDVNYLISAGVANSQEYPTGAIFPIQPEPKGDQEQYNRSYIVNKADNIRIIARKDIENEISGTLLLMKHGDPASGDVGTAPAGNETLAYVFFDEAGRVQIEGNRIYLGRTNGDGEEPYIKFTKYKETVEALKQEIKTLKTAVRTQTHYPKTHNDLDKETTQLSAYIKFGCISIREAYKALHGKTAIIRQLIWRDFYANILYSFPHVLGHAMKQKYNKVKWHHNSSWFKKWCKGETGFPVVDACMKQINTTGYMHNRGRLIVASFLTKTLLIDWREGEKYFAKMLTDYDPASNNGNWQWVASTGADSQPYFRIFNPWEQARNFDPHCKFIKQWLPDLKDVPEKDILNWDSEWEKYKDLKYPKPMVDYKKQKELALKMLGQAFH
ncbi:MAG: deoxyribodipyrimidine photo-lyase, partial [Spirochaetia bacterium]|nr:deoxyribodipyrimidine photo-lyase [Spirochaetia bacterium]